MKKWLKTSFYFKSIIILTYLLSVVTAKDVCDSCVPLSQCPFFASMGSKKQLSWMQKYSCSNHPDDYGIPPGSKDVGGNVCCPNQVWGVDNENHLSPLTNRFGNNQDTPESYNNQIQTPHAYNNGIKNDNTNSNGGYPTLENQQWQNQNNSPFGPKRWSTTEKNTNGNLRPDKNQWDSGNPNYYRGGDNTNWRHNINKRPNKEAPKRSPYFYNWRNFNNNDRIRDRNNDNRVPTPSDNWNNNSGGNPTSVNNPFLANNQQPDNSRGEAGQCDRLTRFPPNPQTDCCGREASDDDRINDAQSFSKPFSFNDFRSLAMQHPNDWSYATFKEEVNGTDGTTENRSTHITFNSTLPSRNFNSTNGTEDDKVTVKIEYRITGGKETELTQYPWTVLLIATFTSGTQTTEASCGGSLISARYVLTAAHCIYDEKATLKNVKVFLAEYDKKTFPTDCKMTSRGQKCIENLALFAANVHLSRGFEESRLLNDIALIELQSNVPYTDYIRPICLPSINVDDPEFARLTLTAAGWGRNGPYQTDVKQSTTIHLVPQYDCRRFYPDLTPRHLCAAGYTGEDTCKGDSGGPLMVKYRGKYFVVGVVSGKRTDVKCGSAVPSLYTNVYHYLNWIRETIAN